MKIRSEEGFLKLFEAIMGQAYEDANYDGDNEKRLKEKAEAIAYIERMKKDFAN